MKDLHSLIETCMCRTLNSHPCTCGEPFGAHVVQSYISSTDAEIVEIKCPYQDRCFDASAECEGW